MSRGSFTGLFWRAYLSLELIFQAPPAPVCSSVGAVALLNSRLCSDWRRSRAREYVCVMCVRESEYVCVMCVRESEYE